MATANKSGGEKVCAFSKAQLARFVKTRNESSFQSNLQFHLDASACGIDVGDLGEISRYEPGGWRWSTPFGELIEHPGGQMELKEASDV